MSNAKKDGPKVYCLCRVSSASQVKSNISIPIQRRSARDYKAKHLAKIPWGDACYPEGETKGFFVDNGVSAWSKDFHNRPASGALLRSLKRGDYLLIYSIDRGFRNVRDFGYTIGKLCEAGINVIFTTNPSVNFSTASGKFIGNMLATIAQYSSDIKSERIREAKAIRKLGFPADTRRERKKESTERWLDNDFIVPEEMFDDKPIKKGRIFPYIRCSHVDSLNSGLGLEAQDKSVMAYCERLAEEHKNLEIQEMRADEAISAFKVPFGRRPKGKEILDQIKPGDHIVVYRLDRAWRSIRDCAEMIEDFAKRGIHVHLASEGVSTVDPMGKLYFYSLSYVAWVESHLTSIRTKESMKEAKRQFRPVSKWTAGGLKTATRNGKKRLVLDIEDIVRHKWVHDLHKETGMSYDKLSDYLENWEADQTGRKVLPKRPRENKPTRYWTRDRIYEHCRRWKKFLCKLVEANDIILPEPMELHRQGKLIKNPECTYMLRLASLARREKAACTK